MCVNMCAKAENGTNGPPSGSRNVDLNQDLLFSLNEGRCTTTPVCRWSNLSICSPWLPVETSDIPAVLPSLSLSFLTYKMGVVKPTRNSCFKTWIRIFLAVPWLRLHDSTAGGTGSIPGRGTKVPTCHRAQPKN